MLIWAKLRHINPSNNNSNHTCHSWGFPMSRNSFWGAHEAGVQGRRQGGPLLWELHVQSLDLIRFSECGFVDRDIKSTEPSLKWYKPDKNVSPHLLCVRMRPEFQWKKWTQSGNSIGFAGLNQPVIYTPLFKSHTAVQQRLLTLPIQWGLR